MDSPEPPGASRPPFDVADERLDAWKDIASYLKRDVSTVQRWEKREGMPVHRHLHDKLGSVYAFRSELDKWSRDRRRKDDGDPVSLDPASPATAASPVRRRYASIAAAAAVGLAIAGVVLLIGTRTSQKSPLAEQNPLAEARFQLITDFDDVEQAAAISPDGKLVAFLSDREGPMDVWVTQVGSGEFHNLTSGKVRELTNPSVRTLTFSPDGNQLSVWVRGVEGNPGKIGLWTVPVIGGQLKPYLNDVAELDWSRDGTRLAYHTPGPGDPMFVKEGQSEGRQIFQAPEGLHSHFPVWSRDGSFIYFVQGTVPDRMDIWRIDSTGGRPERITQHDSYVSHPVFVDDRTLVYLSIGAGDSQPAIYAVDVERRTSSRVSVGVERYSSLSASADGQRLVATLARRKGTLWRIPVSDRRLDESEATSIAVPATSATAPRLGEGYLLYVASRGGREGIWKIEAGSSTEIWGAPGQVVGAPAIAPGGRQIAFVTQQAERARLHVMDADGTNARVLAESLDVRGTPAWASDGSFITVAAMQSDAPRLFKISLDGSSAPLLSDYGIDPVWSPDGRFVAYSGADVGTTFPVKAATPDGKPYPLPSLMLPRGARRLALLPEPRALIVLRGEIERKNFWLIELDTGIERQLTNFGRDFIVHDFDVSRDGREIVFDRMQGSSDIVLIDRALR